jgi:hypothetical protein
MAQLIEDIKIAWASLLSVEGEPGWRSISIASIGSTNLRAGVCFPSREHALLVGIGGVTLPASEKLPDSTGFVVERLEPGEDGRTWLALTRTTPGEFDLFTTMVADVLTVILAEAGVGSNRLLRMFLGRIRAWQEFMRKGSAVLGPEAEIGLIGELLVLNSLLDHGLAPLAAIESWVGPIRGIQDFYVGAGAIEAKTTLSGIGFPIKIGSLDQLDTSIRQPLFVAGVRLMPSDSGRNLSDFVEQTKNALKDEAAARALLDNRLLAAGYVPVHTDRYQRRFALVSTRMQLVDDGFPRLVTGSVPAGVTRAMYEIDFDKVSGASLAMDDTLKQLGVI